MILADAYGWTPAEIAAMSPEFIEQILIFRTARADHELLSMDGDDPKLRKAQARRKMEILKWRQSS